MHRARISGVGSVKPLPDLPFAPPRIGVIDHTFYHSTADTVDFVPAVGIQQATQAYAYILDQINKMDMNQVRLPKKSQQQITQRGR